MGVINGEHSGITADAEGIAVGTGSPGRDSRFRVSFIENKYVDPSPEEDTALRKALLDLMQERSLSFYGQMKYAP